MADCSAKCLIDMLGASGTGGFAPPPALPGQACKREAWLEEEVARLRREVHRTEDINEAIRHEIYVKKSMPTGPKKKLSENFDLSESRFNRVEDEEDEGLHQRHVVTDSQDNLDSAVEEMVKPKIDRSVSENFNSLVRSVSGSANTLALKGSALSMTKPAQAMIYFIAFAFAVFVLVATSTHLGAEDHGSASGSGSGSGSGGSGSFFDSGSGSGSFSDHGEHHPEEHGRRLGGGVSPLMKNTAVTLTGAGMVSLVVNYLNQPLILGYLVGGMLVGPIGLNIVEDAADIESMTSLGLIFLLFMVGLELDIKNLFKMGRVAVIAGFVQLPICGLFMSLLAYGLTAAGVVFGGGDFSWLYVGVTGGFSSTVIIMKLLGQKNETDSVGGRLTMGLLICQDLWAIVLIALQSNLDHPTGLGVLKTFLMLILLIVLALGYAKFVMPAALYFASKSVELMLVLSLAWCFFICSAAILPFMGLPMELGALVAGIALATFPYSAEFNGKIKYIRDFFFTLFFAGMGMMLPLPKARDLFACILMMAIVLISRWVGIFAPVFGMGDGGRLATVATVNMSQIGEFALVLCTMGVRLGHIDEETLEIVILSFFVLAIASTWFVHNNYRVYTTIAKSLDELMGRPPARVLVDDDGEEDREICLLGFYKIAFMLIAECKAKTPEMLKSFHVIDFNKNTLKKLKDLGMKCTCGDISSGEVIEHSQRQPPRVVISTIPDSMLQGISNEKLIKTIKKVWPTTHVISTADTPHQAKAQYAAGADYVLRMAKLSAERLRELLEEQNSHGIEHSMLKDLFERYKERDGNVVKDMY